MSSLIWDAGIDYGPGSVSSSIDANWQIRTSRKYKVWADPNADETYVRANWGTFFSPALGLYKPHPVETATRCTGVDVSFAKPSVQPHPSTGIQSRCFEWSVTASWGFLTVQTITQNSLSGDPFDAQLEVSIEGIEQQRVVDQDIDGVPVVNSAGVPYDPPVLRDDCRCVIRIARNEKDLTPAQILSYANKLNANTWQGLPAKYCKMATPKISPKYSPYLDLLYYRVEYSIEYNPDSWQAIILDAGYQLLDKKNSPAKLRNILDAQGVNITSPAPLNGLGQPLTLPIDPKKVVYNAHDIYFTADFDALNFPQNIFITKPFL